LKLVIKEIIRIWQSHGCVTCD